MSLLEKEAVHLTVICKPGSASRAMRTPHLLVAHGLPHAALTL
jgi:hypothetical protein